jgi:hypothetical protein
MPLFRFREAVWNDAGGIVVEAAATTVVISRESG